MKFIRLRDLGMSLLVVLVKNIFLLPVVINKSMVVTDTDLVKSYITLPEYLTGNETQELVNKIITKYSIRWSELVIESIIIFIICFVLLFIINYFHRRKVRREGKVI
jgi:hypothetical protein